MRWMKLEPIIHSEVSQKKNTNTAITLVQEPDMREVNLAGLCRSLRSLYPNLTWSGRSTPT